MPTNTTNQNKGLLAAKLSESRRKEGIFARRKILLPKPKEIGLIKNDINN